MVSSTRSVVYRNCQRTSLLRLPSSVKISLPDPRLQFARPRELELRGAWGLARETMQRLIEQLADEGDVLEGSRRLGRVHYHLSVYQNFSAAADEPVPASLEVEGHITLVDRLDLEDLQRRRAELTLRLSDGRTLDFLMATVEGTIRSTGRGLYN